MTTLTNAPPARCGSIAPVGGLPRLTRGVVAGALVAAIARRTPVRVRLPDGRTIGAGGATAPVLELVRPRAFFQRLESHPKIGLGEAYMDGDWRAADGTDLADLLAPFAERVSHLLPAPLMRLRRLTDRRHPSGHRNTLPGARRNIAAHYDLPNELFESFLDPTLSYSSALFENSSPWRDQDLAVAQRRKIDAALDRAGVGEGTRLLEIGTGWGELALRAGARGATVTSITLSHEQLAVARRRIENAGLAHRVQVHLQDYRELADQASYDAVVSIEMIEAVGEEFWGNYFSVIDQVLAPGGAAVVQAILMAHDRLLATRNSHGWIQKHIFPGGLIPSLEVIDAACAPTGLRVAAVDRFGVHYAETLRRWRASFVAAWSSLSELGFDERFLRMWEFYLAYSEAGFTTGYLDVAQLTLRR